MKATGIVRRIDDLGRVVIPKEIRRTMRIREGDPLEIYTTVDGEVIFKKYSPIGELSEFAEEFAKALHKAGEHPVAVCDKDHVVAVCGVPKKELLDRRISSTLEDSMLGRRMIQDTGDHRERIKPVDGSDRHVLVGYPILSSGDVCGAIMFLSQSDSTEHITETHRKLMEMAALFLGQHMES